MEFSGIQKPQRQRTQISSASTTIDLCLSVFSWAHFRKTKAAIKLHTLLDLRGNIPSFIHISDGKMADVNVLDILIPEPGSYYVMDPRICWFWAPVRSPRSPSVLCYSRQNRISKLNVFIRLLLCDKPVLSATSGSWWPEQAPRRTTQSNYGEFVLKTMNPERHWSFWQTTFIRRH